MVYVLHFFFHVFVTKYIFNLFDIGHIGVPYEKVFKELTVRNCEQRAC